MQPIKSPNILLIGQCSLHWGRMEFGNIGNYYILEPLVREIHRVFPGCAIRTTMQLSQEFCKNEKVELLPLDSYYGWSGTDLLDARREVEQALAIARGSTDCHLGKYVKAVLESDLVIDFSGDIWGDNADFLGEDRFETGLLKDSIPQILGIPTAMIAGSPGPFGNENSLGIAREVYSRFKLVTNREKLSVSLLNDYGFETSKTYSCACPAFLFEPKNDTLTNSVKNKCLTSANGRPTVGFILCGWNFTLGPFDKWPRGDDEYSVFVDAAEKLVNEGASIIFMSHSNGFHVPPEEFKLIHGRDYPIAKQLFELVGARIGFNHIQIIDDVLLPAQTKAVIGAFDMLVSGRIHGAVAGLSQSIPTAIIDYGHEPKAHKLRGFAEIAGVSDCIADPASGISETIIRVFRTRNFYKNLLDTAIPDVKKLARENFDLLKPLILK